MGPWTQQTDTHKQVVDFVDLETIRACLFRQWMPYFFFLSVISVSSVANPSSSPILKSLPFFETPPAATGIREMGKIRPILPGCHRGVRTRTIERNTLQLGCPTEHGAN